MSKDKKGTPVLEVKPENVVFFELEANDNFDLMAQPLEVRQEIAEKNRRFEAKQLQPVMLDRATPCQCQMPRLQQRAITRMKLMNIQPGPNGEIPMELLQEDVDTRQFGVIVSSCNGEYTGIKMIISKCKACGDIHLFGDIEAVTRCFAEAWGKEMSIEAHRAAAGVEEAIAATMVRDCEAPAQSDDGSPMFVLENTETGERQGADDLGKALFGGAGGPDIRLEPAGESTPEKTEPAE